MRVAGDIPYTKMDLSLQYVCFQRMSHSWNRTRYRAASDEADAQESLMGAFSVYSLSHVSFALFDASLA